MDMAEHELPREEPMQQKSQAEPSGAKGSNQDGPSEARILYRQRIAELKRILKAGSQQRYSAEAKDAALSATVDGTGKLLSLEISDACLKQAHPQVVGADIVAAVREARAVAAREEGKGRRNVGK
jgi:DNA-binding protein YbaB